MGLDVYLEKCPNRAEAERIEEEYEAKSSEAYNKGNFDNLTQAERDAHWSAMNDLAASMGLDKWGVHLSRVEIHDDSSLHPEHMFKIGYFRSSYNGGGINNVLGNIGIDDLYAIFDKKSDDYCFVPDWKASLERCNKALAEYKAHINSDAGKFGVMTFSGIGAAARNDASFLERV
jgi:hypothetical protein